MKMGILYSRSIGALSAKGKYIFTMDGDDMYLSNDVLSSITKIALKSNIDIIIFNSIYSSLKPDVYTTKIFCHILKESINLIVLYINHI